MKKRLLCLLLVAVLAVSFLAGKVPSDKLPEKKNIAITVLCAAFAVGLAISATPLFEDFMKTSYSYNSLFEEQSKISFLMKSGALPRLLEGVFAILSAIVNIPLRRSVII